MAATLYNQVDSNRRKTILLMIGFSFFIVLVSYILVRALGFDGAGALGFSGLFLVISGLINLGSYYWSDKLVLGLTGGRQIEKEDSPKLFRIIENLSIAAGSPMPKIFVIEDPAPNAFATGRDPRHAVVAFTTGLLEKLDNLEIEGVAAHELSHIRNYDTRLMSIIVILVGMLIFLVDIFSRSLWWGNFGKNKRETGGGLFLVLGVIVAILAPILAQVIKFAISRRREFLADASGALLTRHPEGLAKALIKISQDKNALRSASNATAHLYIENPFKGEKAKNWFINLFSTHPPVEDRVKALRVVSL